jgi:hypothetical protein
MNLKFVTESDVLHQVRIMCANWYFTRYPAKLKDMDIKEYANCMRDKASEIVAKNKLYENVCTIFDKDYSVETDAERRYDDKTGDFYEAQKIVFKILDAADKLNQLEEDFTDGNTKND